MFGGKASLRLAAENSRPHAKLVPIRSAPTYFFANGEYELEKFRNGANAFLSLFPLSFFLISLEALLGRARVGFEGRKVPRAEAEPRRAEQLGPHLLALQTTTTPPRQKHRSSSTAAPAKNNIKHNEGGSKTTKHAHQKNNKREKYGEPTNPQFNINFKRKKSWCFF